MTLINVEKLSKNFFGIEKKSQVISPQAASNSSHG